MACNCGWKGTINEGQCVNCQMSPWAPPQYVHTHGFLSLPVGAGAPTITNQLAAQGAQYGLLGQSVGALQGSPAQAQNPSAISTGAYLARLLAAQQNAAFTSGTTSFNTPGFIPAESIKDTGIRAGEITGWRAWKVNPHGFLTSLSASRVWAPNEPMDTETIERDLGIHAFKSLSRLLEFVTGYGDLSLVLGKVEMWGDVVEHEIGYRAEHAAIIALERMINGTKEFLLALRETYGLA